MNKPMKVFLATLFFTGYWSLVTVHCSHASTAGKVNSGNRSYKKGEYDKSLDKYREAQISSPDNSVVHFNMGNSLYKLGQYDEAAQEYQRSAASKDKRVQSKAYYNLGNTAYRQEKTDEALEYYKQALLRDPNDEDAKYNYEYLLKQKMNPASKKKQGNGDKKDKDKQDKSGGKQQQEQQQAQQNKSGMSKEDAERILQVFDEADKNSAQKRKMRTPQLPKTDQDW